MKRMVELPILIASLGAPKSG